MSLLTDANYVTDDSDISDDDHSTAGMEDDPILDTPTTLIPSPGFTFMDRFLIAPLIRLGVMGLDPIEHLLSDEQAGDTSLHQGNVCICCRGCAMNPVAPIAPGAVIVPQDFSNEQLVDSIETELKEHFKICANIPVHISNALSSIEHGDSPNNVWRESLESLDIISVDQIDEVNGEYVEFKALVFDPSIYGWPFDE